MDHTVPTGIEENYWRSSVRVSNGSKLLVTTGDGMFHMYISTFNSASKPACMFLWFNGVYHHSVQTYIMHIIVSWSYLLMHCKSNSIHGLSWFWIVMSTLDTNLDVCMIHRWWPDSDIASNLLFPKHIIYIFSF